MKISVDENYKYLTLLRFSIDWLYRVSNYDTLFIKFLKNDDSWSAQLFKSKFLYFANLDSIIFLKRFNIVKTNWNRYKIKNVYNFSNIIENRNYKNIENFCLTNSSTNVIVTSQRSNKLLKLKLNVLKTFNETNQHNKKHKSNFCFNRFILN